MQALLESIRKLELLNADPQSAELRERFLLLRETIAARIKGASQAEAAFFRLVVQALTQSPPHVVPDIRAEIILDIAQYFYFSGLPLEAIEPLKKGGNACQCFKSTCPGSSRRKYSRRDLRRYRQSREGD